MRRSPSSFSPSLSSHSSSSESDVRDQETKRFNIVSNEDQFKRDVPSELESYANTQFQKYIPEMQSGASRKMQVFTVQSVKYILFQITWTKSKKCTNF